MTDAQRSRLYARGWAFLAVGLVSGGLGIGAACGHPFIGLAITAGAVMTFMGIGALVWAAEDETNE